jgi:hypothetical protein
VCLYKEELRSTGRSNWLSSLEIYLGSSVE